MQHDRSPVSVVLSDGFVRNGYTIKLLNKSAVPRAFELQAEGPDVTLTIWATSQASRWPCRPTVRSRCA